MRPGRRTLSLAAIVLAAAGLPGCATGPLASAPVAAETPIAVSYADLADLVEASDLIIRAGVRRQAELTDERAAGLSPGQARLYIEAETQALIGGTVPVGEELAYLVDVPLQGGDVPRFRGSTVLLFAAPVPGSPGQVQLVDPAAQLPWTAELEERVRAVVRETVAPDAPPAVTGIADAISIPGNLAGESETQLFLETADGSPASITVLRRPGQPPSWGVSFSEIVDQAAVPPDPDTLAWYRLACGLPDALPGDVLLSRGDGARDRAERDYALVLSELGPCARLRAAP